MVLSWISQYWFVILFYVSVGVLIYLNRHRLELHGIVALYKTKFGIKFMQRIADTHPKKVKILGTIGIYVGFFGMILIVAMIIYGIYQLLFEPAAPPMFSPVLPGFNIPGGIHLPLAEGLIALFVVIVIHEFSHGVVSKAYNIPIKSSGLVMFGPIPGAFVEPEEKKLEKSKPKTQLSIFAAGPFSNVILFIALFAVALGTTSLIIGAYGPSGLVMQDYALEDVDHLGGLMPGDRILLVDNHTITSLFSLQQALVNKSPGDDIFVVTQRINETVVLQPHPRNETFPYIGAVFSQETGPRQPNAVLSAVQRPVFWLFGNPYGLTLNQQLGLLQWIFVLSLGIGLVNLLPVGPVDGGRMYLLALKRYFKEKTARKIWLTTSKIVVVAVAVLLLVPIFRAVVGL